MEAKRRPLKVNRIKDAQERLAREADRMVPRVAAIYSGLVSRRIGKGYFALPGKYGSRKTSKNWPLLRRIALVCLKNKIDVLIFLKANFEVGKRYNIPYPYLNVVAANGLDVYREWLADRKEIDPEFEPRRRAAPREKLIEEELRHAHGLVETSLGGPASPSKRLDVLLRFAGTLSPLYMVLQPEVLDALDAGELVGTVAGELVEHQLERLADDDGLYYDDLISAWGKVNG